MLLCADIGNSCIKLGVFNESEKCLKKSFSISATVSRTPDEYFLLINQMFSEFYIDSCAVCSVVPDITANLCFAMKSITHRKPYIISTGTHTGFPIKIENQSQLGADIVSNAAAALSMTSGPIIIVDFGTATTITAISQKSELLGTVIVPGVHVSLKALHETTALITDIGLCRPDGIIGRCTEDSVTVGVIKGAAIMVDGFIRSMRDEICCEGEKPSLISTGGLASLVLPNCRYKFQYVDKLTLIGTARLYFKNVK